MTGLSINGTAGTGKTTEIVKHINEKIDTGINFNTDMAICTFRLSTKLHLRDLLNCSDENKSVATIHGLCYQLLRLNPAIVVDNMDIVNFCQSSGLERTKYSQDWENTDNELTTSSEFFNFYTWMCNNLKPLSKWSEYPGFIKSGESPCALKSFVKEYESYKTEIGKFDFADMISETVKSSLTPDVKVLYVDEFQDLTPAQYQAFKIWTDNTDETVIAGDPLQSIYGFWGGSPDFFNEFDGEKKILPISYRCPVQIWQLAKSVLNAYNMQPPNIKCVKQDGTVHHITHEHTTANVSRYPEDTFHLVRTNRRGIRVSHDLADAGIIFEGIKGWTQNEFRLFNGIQKIRANTDVNFLELIEIVKTFPASAFIRIPKKDMIDRINADARAQIPKQMYNSADIENIVNKNRTFSNMVTFFDIIKSDDPTVYMKMGDFKKAKIGNALKRYEGPHYKTSVRVMTIHASKGLDATNVFLHTGINDQIQSNLFNRETSKEEARVWFVGVTRTQRNLIIVHDEGKNYELGQGVYA